MDTGKQMVAWGLSNALSSVRTPS